MIPLSDIHVNSDTNSQVLLAMAGGYIYSLVNAVRKSGKLRDERVLLFAGILSILVTSVILVALFEPIRLFVIGAINVFLTSLGLKESSRGVSTPPTSDLPLGIASDSPQVRQIIPPTKGP